jgi:hypothetical protein
MHSKYIASQISGWVTRIKIPYRLHYKRVHWLTWNMIILVASDFQHLLHLILHTIHGQDWKVFWNDFWELCWNSSRFQRTRGLRLGFATAHLLRMWVRILPGKWMSLLIVVSCLEKVSASGWPFVHRNPAECDVSESVLRHCWRVGDLKSYVSASIIFLATLSGVQLIPY